MKRGVKSPVIYSCGSSDRDSKDCSDIICLALVASPLFSLLANLPFHKSTLFKWFSIQLWKVTYLN